MLNLKLSYKRKHTQGDHVCLTHEVCSSEVQCTFLELSRFLFSKI